MNRNETLTKPGKTLRAAMILLSMLILTLPATGCKTLAVEVPSDYYVRTLKKGEQFTPPCDGKFVPEARFKEMLDVYIRESYR